MLMFTLTWKNVDVDVEYGKNGGTPKPCVSILNWSNDLDDSCCTDFGRPPIWGYSAITVTMAI